MVHPLAGAFEKHFQDFFYSKDKNWKHKHAIEQKYQRPSSVGEGGQT